MSTDNTLSGTFAGRALAKSLSSRPLQQQEEEVADDSIVYFLSANYKLFHLHPNQTFSYL